MPDIVPIETRELLPKTRYNSEYCVQCKLPWTGHPDVCFLKDCTEEGKHCHEYAVQDGWETEL